MNFLCPSAWMNSFLLLLKYPSSQTLLELKEFEFQISKEIYIPLHVCVFDEMMSLLEMI